MAEVDYGAGKWPKVVILLLTWAGPPERKLAEVRFGYTKKTIQALKKHLHYPNLGWHIADDGSPKVYQEKVKALLSKDNCTFTDTKKGWDRNNNWNTGAKVAFGRADIVVSWPDDYFMDFDFDLRPSVRLLMSYEDICYIRLKPKEHFTVATPLERVGQKWWLVNKKSPATNIITTVVCIRHKRFLDHYGYLPANIWPLTIAEKAQSWAFRDKPGPGAIIPEQIRIRGDMPFGTASTWEAKQNSGAIYRKHAPWENMINKLTIIGPTKLNGIVKMGGSKNEALSILAASLLTTEQVCLKRVPNLIDVRT